MTTDSSTKARNRWWMLFIGGYIVLLFAAIMLPLGRSSFWLEEAGRAKKIILLTIFWLSCAVLWCMLSAMIRLIKRRAAIGQLKRVHGPARAVLMILLVAVAARALTVFTTYPQLSDDIWRYILDGRTLALGDNPYNIEPNRILRWGSFRWHGEVHAHDLPDVFNPDGVIRRINHGDLVTIYQPTSQWVFAASGKIAPLVAKSFSAARIPKAEVTANVFRTVFVLFDIWIIALLILKLLRENRSVWWTVLYAWHPLVISEVAASGHQDVIGIAWLLMSLTMLDWLNDGYIMRRGAPGFGASNLGATSGLSASAGTDRTDTGGQAASGTRMSSTLTVLITLGAGGAFALAIGVKPLVAPLALSLGWSLRRRPAILALAAAAGAATLVGLYLPFALMEGGLSGMLETVRTFVATWAFNSSIQQPLIDLLGSTPTAKSIANVIVGGVLMAVLITCVVKAIDVWRTTMIYLFAALLLSSTAHPWYLLWSLAIVPIHFSTALWIFSLTINWSYAALIDRESYRVPLWVLIAEYAPVYTALLWRAIVAKWSSGQVAKWLPPFSRDPNEAGEKVGSACEKQH